jgi:hypothetical protein
VVSYVDIRFFLRNRKVVTHLFFECINLLNIIHVISIIILRVVKKYVNIR